METKHLILLFVTIGGTAGGYAGSLLDHTGIGLWSILLSAVGGFAGIWLGWKIGNM